ncbi:MAG: dihydropteroate synthase [Deltaproteobacteria bacterium]|nr:dihydropteroate synthase [Deltaproteobacteria bacterium]
MDSVDFSLKWHEHRLDLGARTHLMGVLNVTPDSFSDGGRYFSEAKAVARGIEMARDGADIIDIGGESTRPYSDRLSTDEEMSRVIPVIRRLSREIPIPISIDTYKSKVAREALNAGASIINDISALRLDPRMAEVAAEAGVPVILMHMQGTPDNMQLNPRYDDLLNEIIDFFKDAVKRCKLAGIKEHRIILDPGIGFGKTFDHNLSVIHQLKKFQVLQKPLLVGPSNKAFIGKILGRKAHERDTGTMAAVAACVMNGAHVVRVHNVKLSVETIKVIDAIRRERVNETVLG